MRYIELDKLTIRFYFDKRDFALPIRIQFGKKIFSLQILCFEVEFDWITEDDIDIEEEESNER